MNIEQEEWEEEQAIEGIYTDMWDTMWGKEPKDSRQRAELRKRARQKYYRMLEEEEEEDYIKAYKEGAEYGYNKAKEDVKHDLMMKLKDEGIVKLLKVSILRNERLSSQEQQELCAWIECAMDFGENLDECAKELEYAKTIIQDLLDNSDEYARQRAIDFLKESE